jgi:hypothetical protein
MISDDRLILQDFLRPRTSPHKMLIAYQTDADDYYAKLIKAGIGKGDRPWPSVRNRRRVP